MNRKMWVALISAAALAAPLPGCVDRQVTEPTSTAQWSVEAELAQLKQRVGDLRAAVQVAGRLTPGLQQELASITKSIKNWQARSGRKDINVTQMTHPHPGQDGTLALAPRGSGGGACAHCPPIIVSGGQVCFLQSEGSCPGPFGAGRICVYSCIGFLSA